MPLTYSTPSQDRKTPHKWLSQAKDFRGGFFVLFVLLFSIGLENRMWGKNKNPSSKTVLQIQVRKRWAVGKVKYISHRLSVTSALRTSFRRSWTGSQLPQSTGLQSTAGITQRYWPPVILTVTPEANVESPSDLICRSLDCMTKPG